MAHSNRTLYDFSRFKSLSNFVLDIYDGNISIEDPKKRTRQIGELNKKINGL